MGQELCPVRPVVLVVEDETIVRMDLGAALGDAGFDVIDVANADDAIAVLCSEPNISLIVTDIEMPGSIDGLRLAKLVRDRWPPVPIILVSGRCTPLSEDLPQRSRFFAKPYDVGCLIDAARAYLR